ncbi:matrix-remodeling-associated protein 7 [Ascaphus truei]|uniref:matrix-remodeling-associated protein 7 n=1 Tax=Ascaphus truei TaxID=8439 RepID=UPI003F59D075
MEADFYLAVPLVFTVLAVILATVLVKRSSAGEKRPAEGEREPERAAGAREPESAAGEREPESAAVEERKAEGAEGKEGGERGAPGPKTGEVLVEDVGAVEEMPQEGAKEEEKETSAAQEGDVSDKSVDEDEDSQVLAPCISILRSLQLQPDEHQHPGRQVRRDCCGATAQYLIASHSWGSGQGGVTWIHGTISWQRRYKLFLPGHERVTMPDAPRFSVAGRRRDAEGGKILQIREADDADEDEVGFRYSPGKLRGGQYEKMLTREELQEEQRVQREQLGAIFNMMKENRETFGPMSDGDIKEQLKLYNM